MSTLQEVDAPTVPVQGRRPGRPRATGHDERILAAVLELVDEGAPVTLRAVVERSGTSRASLYRRWGSLQDLLAAALDAGRSAPAVAHTYADPDDFVVDLLSEARALSGAEHDRRLRRRVLMGLQDPSLQRTYWEQHVSRRRAPMREVIEAGKRDGVFVADLDTEACCDLLSAVFYYQVLVRGERDAVAGGKRVEAALRTAIEGMRARP